MIPDILPNFVSGLPLASQAAFGTLFRPTLCPRSSSERCWSILERFLDPRTMKNHEKVLYCLQKTTFSRFPLRAFRRSATSSQNHPRSIPRDPKSDPGGVKSGPGEPQERPGRAGAARRHPQIRAFARRRAPRAPGRGPGATSERSCKRFWSLPGLIWELFESPRDFIFKLFRSCPRTLRLQPLCPTNAGSAGPALAFTIS